MCAAVRRLRVKYLCRFRHRPEGRTRCRLRPAVSVWNFRRRSGAWREIPKRAGSSDTTKERRDDGLPARKGSRECRLNTNSGIDVPQPRIRPCPFRKKLSTLTPGYIFGQTPSVAIVGHHPVDSATNVTECNTPRAAG